MYNARGFAIKTERETARGKARIDLNMPGVYTVRIDVAPLIYPVSLAVCRTAGYILVIKAMAGSLYCRIEVQPWSLPVLYLSNRGFPNCDTNDIPGPKGILPASSGNRVFLHRLRYL